MAKKEKDLKDYTVEGIESIDSDVFNRQKRIKGWDQAKIHDSTVMVIGAGAIGNELVKNLVLIGIGEIILIDYDFINPSNLNRCILFNISNARQKEYKVDIIKEACARLNPDTKITGIKDDLNDIDKTLYKRSDVICSCVDNIEARIEANNYAYYYKIPFVDSGIDGFFGSIQSVYSEVSEAACFQCNVTDTDLDLMWKKFSCTGQEIDTENGETSGIIASIITTTSIIGGIQSQEVLKFLLGIDNFKEYKKWNPYIGQPLIGKQLNYNGILNRFKIVEKLKNPECWTCSSKKILDDV
ncbi:MAG: ThiF family adenylyltransferase [Promethearchaeota archaeon]|jgi:molybdopterin/thiamine biosynthesis adenylyltransferase